LVIRGFNLEVQQRLKRTIQQFLLSSCSFDLVVVAVGTVENSRAVGEFSKRCGSGGKTSLVFHGFHSAAVSTVKVATY
jgi:hypothetical protein